LLAGQSFSPRDEVLIRDELDKILSSKRFVHANQISNLLRYVVEETLAGRRDRIKAFSVAQDVFGRDVKFDQQRDPIVRVEASRLRKCLVDYYESSGLDSTFHIDVPKGGYAPTFTKLKAPENSTRRWTPGSLSLVGLAVLMCLLVFWFGWGLIDSSSPQEAGSPSTFLAVLPLTYSDDDVLAGHLADSFVDSTITLLARLPNLSVMAHASMMEFDRERVSIRLLKDEFGVTHVLRGSIESQQNGLRVRIQLIDTETSATIWSKSLDGSLSNAWGLQDELAIDLLNALSIQLESVEMGYMLSRYTESTEALTLYRQGQYMMLPPSEIKRVQAAQQIFARVREIDPEFAGGYAGAAFTYAVPVLFQNTHTPDEHLAQAKNLADKAIHIDPVFGAGYAVLGFTQALAGDKIEALDNARLATAIQPGDAFVQFLGGMTFVLSGIPEAAFAPLEEAMRLNPVEKRVPYLNVYGISRFANQEYQMALDLFAKNQDRMGPQGPHVNIFRAATYAHLGNDEMASAIIKELKVASPEFPYTTWLERWLGRGEHLQVTLKKLSDNGLSVPTEYLPE
jgi:TolB-like protein/Flp pilus assembly protein TadD